MKIFFGDARRKTSSTELLEALRTIRPVPWASHAVLPRELEPHQLHHPEILEECLESPPAIPCFRVVFTRPVYGRVQGLRTALADFRGRVEWVLYRGTREVVEGCPPRHWILAPRLYRDLDLAGCDPKELDAACLDRQPELFWHAEDDLSKLAAFIQEVAKSLPSVKVH